MTALGEHLRAARHAKGLSLRKLGKEMSRSHGALGAVERGEEVPSKELLRRLCLALDLDLSELEPLAGRLPPEMVAYLCANPGARKAVQGMMDARGHAEGLDAEGNVLARVPFGQSVKVPAGIVRWRYVLENKSCLGVTFTTPPYSKEGA